MPRIFISHSSHDAKLADQICSDLRCAGYDSLLNRGTLYLFN